MKRRSAGHRGLMTNGALPTWLGALAVAVTLVTGCNADEPTPEAPSQPAVVVPDSQATPSPGVEQNRPPTARPERITIPAIEVDTDLMDLGLEPDGALEVPPSGFPAGWYTGSPVPGDLGPAIVAGHVDWEGEPGVFYRLHEMTVGDEITATRSDGNRVSFRVTRVERHAKDEFPTSAVYGDIDHSGLRLITCGGDFDTDSRSYRDNVVVFAELVDSGVPTDTN